MKINKIFIKNFKSYYNDNEYDLTVDDNKNVILIIADSGYGKTTLMQAINWVLYDEEYLNRFNKGKGNNKITLENWINSTYIEEIKRQNTYGEIEVSMHFEDDNNKYQITNEYVFSFDNSTIQYESHSHTLKKLANNSSQWTSVKSLESEINKILPKNIVQYFFFDAEKQSRLTDPSNQKLVREAIYNVIGLKTLEEAEENLKQIARDFNKQLSALPLGDFQKKQNRIVKLEESINQDEIELKDIQSEIEEIEEYIIDIERKLIDIPDSSNIQEEIDTLKKEKSQLISEKDSLENNIANSNFLLTPTFLESDLYNLKTALNNLKNEGKIPGSINTKLIDEILMAKTCICGADLEKNEGKKAHIEQLKKRIAQQSEDSYKLLEIFVQIGSYIETTDFNSLKRKHNDYIKGVDSLENGIVQIETKIKELSENLGDLDNKEIKELKEKKDELDIGLKKNIEVKGSIAQRKESNEKELEQFRDELGGLALKNKQAQKLRKMIDLTRKVEHELNQIFHDFAEQIKRTISTTTESSWNSLVETTRRLNFEIDDDYKFKVTNNYGSNAINDLSEGQKQGLVLAFVSAISKASDTFPPYIIDMPFGRLGESPQTEVAKLLPKSCKQLILLLNKPEYNEITKKYLQPKSKKTYTLTFDSNKRKTIIN